MEMKYMKDFEEEFNHNTKAQELMNEFNRISAEENATDEEYAKARQQIMPIIISLVPELRAIMARDLWEFHNKAGRYAAEGGL